MNRPVLELSEVVRPTLGTIADTIVDLVGRKIFRNERRDCTAERLRQDRHVHLEPATFL